MTEPADATPRAAHGAPLALWLAVCRGLIRYHRYEVSGMEHLDGLGAALMVGYHGRPAAWDLCMLSVRVYERFGYLPHGIVHAWFGKSRLTRWLVDGLGFVTGEGEGIAEAVRRGEMIVTVPGGTREGYRDFRCRYRVDWGQRTGYLRLALRHRLPIVPVGASGVDDTFIGLNDGYRWGKRLGIPGGIPFWFGVGMTGLFPFSLPFPSKIRQVVGAPIWDTARGDVDHEDRGALRRIHRRVSSSVQELIDRARSAHAGEETT